MQKNSMATLHDEYSRTIQENITENLAGAKTLAEDLKAPKATAHGKPIRALYMPKLYPSATVDLFSEIGRKIYGILSKVIAQYKKDPSYRKLFSFPKELEAWILLPAQYTCPIPLMRADIFFHETTQAFTFCEFNCDGASAMNHDTVLYHGIAQTPAFQQLAKEHKIAPFEYFHSWVDAFLKDYREAKKDDSLPTVGIVDFLESAMINDFYAFQKAFEERGIKAYICEVRDLIHQNKGLYTKDGIKIDAVYRRTVTGEMYEKREEIQDYLNAIKAGDVCLIGPLSTQVAHNKIIFEILHSEATTSFIANEEQLFIKKHIPFTCKLEETKEEELFANKNQWIIKPMDLYAGKGVYSGKDSSKEEWEKIVTENKNNHYLAQHFSTPFETMNYDFSLSQKPQPFKNTTGLYLYNGKLVGVLSKAGPNNIVTSSHGAYYMASAVVE